MIAATRASPHGRLIVAALFNEEKCNKAITLSKNAAPTRAGRADSSLKVGLYRMRPRFAALV